MTLNRCSGLFVAGLGVVLYFWIVPWQTETVAYGWLKPGTLPSIMSVIAILLGLFQFAFPSGAASFDAKPTLRASLFLGICLVTVYLTGLFGYLVAAPIMVIAIQLLIGERRPLWLFSSIILVPLIIWFSVVIILNRPLP